MFSFHFFGRCLRRAVQHRPYAMYQPFVRDPIYRPEQQDSLFETGEAKKLEAIPVKAAKNDHNASIFYDEQVK